MKRGWRSGGEEGGGEEGENRNGNGNGIGGREKDKVIVVGHSVGAYIGLEVLRGLRGRKGNGKGERRGEGAKEGKREKREEIGGGEGEEEEEEVSVLGFIGLWPTVTWIGRSVRGRRVGVSSTGFQFWFLGPRFHISGCKNHRRGIFSAC